MKNLNNRKNKNVLVFCNFFSHVIVIWIKFEFFVFETRILMIITIIEALKTVSNYGWCTRDYIVELLPAPMPPINII